SHHFAFRPVDASFMGLPGHDDRLPRADAGAADAERRGIDALRRRLEAAPEPATSGARLDQRLMRAELTVAAATLDRNPRFVNPAWYSGEAAFGIISLLLPPAPENRRDAVTARLRAMPDFLADGRARLT